MVAKKRKRELEERTASRGQHESYESAIERSPTAEREAEADGAGAPDGIAGGGGAQRRGCKAIVTEGANFLANEEGLPIALGAARRRRTLHAFLSH